MFGFLRGKVFAMRPTFLLLDVGGIGYKIFCPQALLSKIENGQDHLFFIKPIFREDDQLLFGFAHEAELELFEMLIKINGIGPKTALNLIDFLPEERLLHAIMEGEVAALCAVPGIGKKTAERILVELKDKLPALSALTPKGTEKRPTTSRAQIKEALAALLTLGYSQKSAERILQDATKQLPKEASTAAVISFCLSELQKSASRA